jgi:autophagy-related protein 18
MIRKGSQSLTKQFATSLAPLLPTSVTEIWEPSRDFAHIKLPAKTSGNKAGCLVGMSKEEPNIFVVTADGEFLNYKVDLIQGGEGKLDKQYSYLPLNNLPPLALRSLLVWFGWGLTGRLLDSPEERSGTPAV